MSTEQASEHTSDVARNIAKQVANPNIVAFRCLTHKVSTVQVISQEVTSGLHFY